MRIQLIWTDPTSGEQRQPVLETPIALGSVFEAMPDSREGQRISRLTLQNAAVADYHALIEVRNDTPLITAQGTQTIQINGLTLPMSTLFEGDVLQIGPFSIQLNLSPAEGLAAEGFSTTATAAPAATAPTAMGGAVGEAMGVAPLAMQNAGDLGPEGCDRKVGFLFKRRCGRTTRVGCPYCNGGQTLNDPYFYDEYNAYPGYGTYHRGYWGHSYYSNRDYYYYDPVYGRTDFTEADAAAFERENDQDYEMDMGAS